MTRNMRCILNIALACAAWLASLALAMNASGRQLSSSRTVWDGVYTEEQATRGQTQYMQTCAACHAKDLRGGSVVPSLVEESFSFLFGGASVGELFSRIQRLMPSDRPNSLSSQSYCDIVAFILQSNKFPSGAKELDADLETLRRITVTTKQPEAQATQPQAQPMDRFVTVNGLRIHYLDWGADG